MQITNYTKKNGQVILKRAGSYITFRRVREPQFGLEAEVKDQWCRQDFEVGEE